MANGILHVPHIAPLRFVPRRGRNVRAAFARVETAVRIHELDEGEMPLVANDGTNRPLHLHDGSLWTPLIQFGSYRDERPELAAYAEMFVAKVEGRDLAWNGALHPLLHRSPFAPDLTKIDLTIPRSAAPEPGTVGRMVSDGRERSSRDMALFAESNLRGCGKDLLVRVGGPLLVAASAGDDWELTTRYGVSTFPGDYAAPGRGAALAAFRDRHECGPPRSGDPLDPARLGSLPLRDNDDDLLLYVNYEPQVVAAMARETLAAVGERDPDGSAFLGARLDAFRALTDVSMFGGIGRGEAADAADAIHALATETRALRKSSYEKGIARLRLSASYAMEFVAPALSGTLDAGDEAALDGLRA